MLFDAAPSAILLPSFALPDVALPSALPDETAELTALLHAQHQAHLEFKRQALSHIQHLYEQFVLSRCRQFGSSSEQSSAQRRLFDEAEVLAEATTEAQDLAPLALAAADDSQAKHANKPARGKRGPLPADLPRVDIVHEAPESERTCPCGAPMVEIGQDISEQL